MDASTLLADPAAIRLECFVSEANSITLVVRAVQPQPCCPSCQQPSHSLHSHYLRAVADLPWHGVSIKLELHTRKFRCRDPRCSQKVFCERLPNVVAAYARQTVRLNDALTLLAFALGGEAGSRASKGLNFGMSGDSLLRRIRRFPLPQSSTSRVLGVDDWARRKGQNYGTILVDLEKRKPVDLLNGREAETLAQWLRAHPEVSVIARDRAGAYADGARQGAPHAIQVADRWHLLKNLTEAVERSLQSCCSTISSAAEVVRQAQINSSGAVIGAGPTTMLSSRNNHQVAGNRERKLARYQEVVKLHKRGVSILGVAQTLKMSRMTVYRYLRSDGFPERALGEKRRSALEPYLTYIHQRFAAGYDNATQLWREAVARGYTGRPAMVRRYVRRLRVRVRRMPETEKQKRMRLKNSFATPSLKRTAHWLLKEEKDLGEEERLFINELLCDSPGIKRVRDLGRQFQRMMKERDEEPFAKWLTAALQSGIKEVAGFADGLKKDFNAVTEALRSKWSNGQTEGQINRLKYLKRQMYGRAKLDLLKARVLYAA